ncbi:MAG TPA: YicC family protein [Pyrinomonadaceae bacterium]|nr:YicC family protein [Pyrinomonadaceae bacterium]
MRSMTGFGRGSYSEDGISVSIELKTVNNRFLDINLRLPSDFQQLEGEIKRAVVARLSRGRVDLNLQADREESTEYELNRPLIRSYLAVLNEIREEFSLTGEPDINVIARLPNVLNIRKSEVPPEAGRVVIAALEKALDDLNQMRENEGSMLKAELLARLSNIETRLAPIENEADGVADEIVERLNKRIGDLRGRSESQIEIDQGRLAQEVAFLADRADISEEISRLRTHIEHFRTIVDEEKEVGKRLDFLTQELNREANTIASKTANMTVKENSLQIKSEIEKIREQVQNVE